MSAQLDFWPQPTPPTRLRWSWSRAARLRFCHRKYYLHHFASRGGADAAADSLAHQAFVLRALQTRQMWVGKVVHEVIELGLGTWRNGAEVAVDELVVRGVRRMRAQFAESLHGVYRQRPESACGLMEHEYAEDVGAEEWQAQRDRMAGCVRAFCGLPMVSALREMPSSRFLSVEAHASFEIDGAHAVVRPDVVWRGERGELCIADWKTGRRRPEEETAQLAVYGLYAARTWLAREEDLVVYAVHLDGESATGQVSERAMSRADLAAAEAEIRASVQEMRQLADGDIQDLSRFPMTSDIDKCRRCPLRRLCGRCGDSREG